MKEITGTNEWAASTVNCVRGCSHGCWYGYCRANAARFKQRKPEEWTREEIDELAVNRRFGLRDGRVMLPSSHDITPGTVGAVTAIACNLLAAGNELLIVSKPHLECIEQLVAAMRPGWKQWVTFRFTIGSTRDDVLRLWEPGAPPFWERMEALRFVREEGFKVGVSIEPMLEDPREVIAAVTPFVDDTIWLGRANQLMARLKLNKAPAEVMEAAKALLKEQTDDWCLELYRRWKNHPRVRFKDSIKRVVGLVSLGKGTDT